MPRSRQSRAERVAEKMLREAIAGATIELQAELAAANREIERLRAALAGVARVASVVAAPQAVTHTIAPHALPPELRLQAEPEPLREALPIDLADEDNLGPGRWA